MTGTATLMRVGLLAGSLVFPSLSSAESVLDAVVAADLIALEQAIASGGDPNALDMFLGMPLHNSARSGWVEGIPVLLAAGADPFADDGTGTAVAAAAASNNVDALKAFETNGVSLLAPDDAGKTPLHAASASGALEAVSFLLERGADLTARLYIRGEMPLHLAAREGHPDVVDALLRHGADPAVLDTDYDQTALHFAVRSGSLPTIRRLVDAGAPLNAVNDNEATALDLARNKGSELIIQYLQGIGAKSAR